MPGCRFRYLFPKPDVNSDEKTSAINDHLLGLLKSASGQSVSTPEKHDVLQVKNKLRSFLLSHNLPRSTDPFQQKSGQRESSTAGNSYTTASKSKILTVEEIEAQLNRSTKPPVSVPVANSQHVEKTHDKEFEKPQRNNLLANKPFRNSLWIKTPRFFPSVSTILYLRYFDVRRKPSVKKRKSSAITFAILEYADDIDLIFEEQEKAQVFLDELTKVIPSFGMHFAPTKSSTTVSWIDVNHHGWLRYDESLWGARWLKWLECKFTDRKTRGSNPTSAS
ncbi:hypothetical protein T265_06526 [Opisthorchis viverrini]|uniref:Reverse transcriptase domain-containing protein n=1 Tax=Opisthorchis viverrini TaxID=6198 RepID=A0A074ZKA9_OPIVI|nr:hypothetical protein T265_06526 [Opisthorchis viverrini]KER26172.1 hypothetical protein T265_06526 [Opisthorchis viverrini]